MRSIFIVLTGLCILGLAAHASANPKKYLSCSIGYNLRSDAQIDFVPYGHVKWSGPSFREALDNTGFASNSAEDQNVKISGQVASDGKGQIFISVKGQPIVSALGNLRHGHSVAVINDYENGAVARIHADCRLQQ
jgi:hypothetical protein